MGDHCLKDMVLGEPYVREALLDLQKGVDQGTHMQRAFIVLACDGLFDVMEDSEVTERVASWKGHLQEAAKDLVSEGHVLYGESTTIFNQKFHLDAVLYHTTLFSGSNHLTQNLSTSSIFYCPWSVFVEGQQITFL
jgi:hypothetical protein